MKDISVRGDHGSHELDDQNGNEREISSDPAIGRIDSLTALSCFDGLWHKQGWSYFYVDWMEDTRMCANHASHSWVGVGTTNQSGYLKYWSNS